MGKETSQTHIEHDAEKPSYEIKISRTSHQHGQNYTTLEITLFENGKPRDYKTSWPTDYYSIYDLEHPELRPVMTRDQDGKKVAMKNKDGTPKMYKHYDHASFDDQKLIASYTQFLNEGASYNALTQGLGGTKNLFDFCELLPEERKNMIHLLNKGYGYKEAKELL
ncbi:MAG: hypothetical protein HY445_01825 [Candidatus Niyogibacteria bacterium]|nr:hypothetical protein [Candidatus Niyogibacteria bacterium]